MAAMEAPPFAASVAIPDTKERGSMKSAGGGEITRINPVAAMTTSGAANARPNQRCSRRSHGTTREATVAIGRRSDIGPAANEVMIDTGQLHDCCMVGQVASKLLDRRVE